MNSRRNGMASQRGKPGGAQELIGVVLDALVDARDLFLELALVLRRELRGRDHTVGCVGIEEEPATRVPHPEPRPVGNIARCGSLSSACLHQQRLIEIPCGLVLKTELPHRVSFASHWPRRFSWNGARGISEHQSAQGDTESARGLMSRHVQFLDSGLHRRLLPLRLMQSAASPVRGQFSVFRNGA